MRTNIDIDDELLAKAMQAGPYTTKKETVEAGLRLLARQAAYREILKWKGKLKWEGDESIDWTQPAEDAPEEALEYSVQEPRARYTKTKAAAPSGRKAARRAGR
ncbi:MAG: type II toxin-antitoxin system VapB family antitoxin [Proteobacteria bacterium]|nr:type II toxin-antitoxin system VapB family antitoxin [Burkholderiales bacterium]MCA0310026.1 type II toxin-antitoxin system VapB family antitoxin [Pseudomonadota bacterium]